MHSQQPAPVQMPSNTNSQDSLRFDFIDGLRGFAIFLVILRHYYMGTYMSGFFPWFNALGLGYLGVHLFLLISGFCVSWPYVGPSKRLFSLSDFLGRRATRILPSYYIALLISFLLALPMDVQNALFQLITHITMTHNLFFSTVLALNGPFWSIALEFQLYLLFPLILLGYRRFGLLPMLITVFAIQMVFRTLVAMAYGTTYSDQTFTITWSVIGRMFEFGLGLWAAVITAQWHQKAPERRLLQILPILIFMLAGCALAAKRFLGETSPITDLLWTSMFLGLLLYASRPKSIANRLFSYRPLVQLGIISYSVYLVHELVLRNITTLILNTQQPLLAQLLTIPVSLVGVFAGYVFYRCVEKPAVQYFAQRRKKAGTTNRVAAVPPSVNL